MYQRDGPFSLEEVSTPYGRCYTFSADDSVKLKVMSGNVRFWVNATGAMQIGKSQHLNRVAIVIEQKIIYFFFLQTCTSTAGGAP